MKFNKSMVEYALEQIQKLKNGEINILQFRNNIENYANFLSQKLEIWMFVPAVFKDGKWVVLEEPKGTDVATSSFFEMQTDYHLEKEYQTALSKVIFEGFSFKHHHLNNQSIATNDNIFHVFWNTDGEWRLSKGIDTIEDLISYNLDIKDTIAKELGLI